MKRTPKESDSLLNIKKSADDGMSGTFGYKNPKNLSHSAFQTMVYHQQTPTPLNIS